VEKIKNLVTILENIYDAENSERILSKFCIATQDSEEELKNEIKFCKGIDCFECPFWTEYSVREAQKTQVKKLELILGMQ
jgi:hypothetical protein